MDFSFRLDLASESVHNRLALTQIKGQNGVCGKVSSLWLKGRTGLLLEMASRRRS
jgi:hypothetical protein